MQILLRVIMPIIRHKLKFVQLQIEQMRLLLMCVAEKWEKGAIYEGKKVGGQWKSKNNNQSSEQKLKKTMPEAIEFAQNDEQNTEVLSKRLVYYLDDGSDINAVKKFLDTRGIEMVEKVDNPDTGFSSFLFRQGNNSMYVFVGTNDDKDWASNRGVEVGRSQFEPDRERIKNILAREKGMGRNVKVSGHSLGGALAQITSSEYPELINEVSTFNSAGINTSTAKLFKSKNPNLIKVTHYVNQGDVVSSLGQAYIPGSLKFFGNASGTHEDPHGVLLTDKSYSKELSPPKWLTKKASV